MSETQLDELDRIAAEAFEGYVVRKDLAQRFRGQYPVPTYVGEFLLGRYCATTDEAEIQDGLDMVQRTMEERTVRAGQHELFKSRARERGAVKLLDLVSCRLETKVDRYLVTLPSLQLNDVRIDDALVRANDRMLTGGFYAEVSLEYDPSESFPFGISALRPIQMSTHDAADILAAGRTQFDTESWKQFLLRSVGFEPGRLTPRQRDILLLRMVPFVVQNYNLVEIGPRGTGKSHLFQQVSPYAHLVSGGKATVARMFVNNANGQRGLVCQYDVVCFDEVSGVAFDQKDGVNIMKGFMESGEFSRGRESIRAEGSIVLVGNFDVDMRDQLRKGHLFKPLPPEMRDDTAFMDRIHAYVPGWDVPKLDASLFTSHFGLVSDFLSEGWRQLRHQSRLDSVRAGITYGSALSGRDRRAVDLTTDGLLRLIYPDAASPIAREDLRWAATLAMECRRRVKEQQKRVGRDEFGATDFTFTTSDGAVVSVECPEALQIDHEGAADIEGRSGRVAAVAASREPSPAPQQRSALRTYIADDRIGGFRILGPLGKGGFSSVYRVLREVDGKEYALKVFNARGNVEIVRRELQLLQKVNHPNVVKVVWADQLEDGRWYLVTELVEGETLEDAARGSRPLTLQDVIGVGRSVLSALCTMHPDQARIDALRLMSNLTDAELNELMGLRDDGIVHRDIKPQNIMRENDGRIVLIDFNIASPAGGSVHTVSGTPAYRCPDVSFSIWDVTTDLFALGVTLYELVCHNHPYPNESPTTEAVPVDPNAFRADVPDSVAKFLLRACAPFKADRFASAHEMLVALDEAGGASA